MDYFKPIKIGDITPIKGGRHGMILDIICQFQHTPYEAVEIDWKALNYPNAGRAAAVFAGSIKRTSYNMAAMCRGSHCYLVKKKGEYHYEKGGDAENG